MTTSNCDKAQGAIVLLNGVSSSGKTTLAKELVKMLPGYFHLGIDDFDIMIERMEDREARRLIPVDTERLFHRTIAAFSNCGVNTIIDHVLHDQHAKQDFFDTLRGYPILLVGVHCPPEELERRERSRGDRTPGLWRRQIDSTHCGMSYDVEVNTCVESPEACAIKVVEALRAHRPRVQSASL